MTSFLKIKTHTVSVVNVHITLLKKRKAALIKVGHVDTRKLVSLAHRGTKRHA